MRLGEWIAETKTRLTGQRSGFEARLLAAEIIHQSPSWVLTHPETLLFHQEISQLNSLRERLRQGEPLPYLLGHWEFFDLDLIVTPAVLIPRPETELLVEHALNWLSCRPAAKIAADVGTGSGCIALSLARRQPQLRIIASDYSLPALRVAAANVARYEATASIALVQADLLEPFDTEFDLICANLPYVPTRKLAALPPARFEPRAALDGGADGLYWIERLLRTSPRVMRPRGLILLEIEAEQGGAALELAARILPSAKASLHPDLSGKDRLISIQA